MRARVLGAVFLAVLVASGPLPAESQAKKKILFFSKSSGFEHPVIKMKGEEPSLALKVLKELAGSHGWELTHTKDGSFFTKENIAKFDAFFFYTTGVLTEPGTDKNPPMTPEGKAAFLDAIRSGKGFVGSHSAADTFHPSTSKEDRFRALGEKNDPYLLMLGGEFIRHGKQQPAHLVVVDPKFPGLAGAGESLKITEEWYSFKDYQDDLHVLLVQDTEGMAKTEGDSVYNRPPYPATWARMHGKGRVFYTSLGHRDDVWTSSFFHGLLAGGLSWALGEVEADVTPNVQKVAPGYKTIPPEK
jgi:type 1 glutamine amidotransferase